MIKKITQNLVKKGRGVVVVKRQEKIKIRKIDGLEIIFYDKKTIYVKHRYGVSVYNRWLVQERGFYKNKWARFRDEILRKRKNLTWGEINALAEKYEIDVFGGKVPCLDGEELEYIS